LPAITHHNLCESRVETEQINQYYKQLNVNNL